MVARTGSAGEKQAAAVLYPPGLPPTVLPACEKAGDSLPHACRGSLYLYSPRLPRHYCCPLYMPVPVAALCRDFTGDRLVGSATTWFGSLFPITILACHHTENGNHLTGSVYHRLYIPAFYSALVLLLHRTHTT